MSENIKSSNTITADTIVQQVGNTKVEIKPGKIIINTETQLDRVEKKVDRILELLEGKELSTSVVIDSKKVGKLILKDGTKKTYRGVNCHPFQCE